MPFSFLVMIQILFRGEIVLQPAEYATFVLSLSREPSSAASFATALISVLLSYERDTGKCEKSLKKLEHTMDYILTIFLHTLQVLDNFVTINRRDPDFMDAITEFDQWKREHPHYKFKRTYDVLGTLGRQQPTKMLVECSTLDSAINSNRATTTSSINTGGGGITATLRQPSNVIAVIEDSLTQCYDEFPFYFIALENLLRGEHARNIFDHLLNILKKLPIQLSSMPESTQTRVLALLLMLREFLISNPTGDLSWLQQAGITLHMFYKWPRPYGVIARDILEFINMEMRAPGANLIERIIFENPKLHPEIQRKKLPTNQKEEEVEDMGAIRVWPFPIKGERLVHVFADATQHLCKAHKAILNSSREDLNLKGNRHMALMGFADEEEDEEEKDEEYETLYQKLRREILTHILDCDFVLSSDPHESDPLYLKDRDERVLVDWYIRALEILEKSKDLPTTAEHQMNEAANEQKSREGSSDGIEEKEDSFLARSQGKNSPQTPNTSSSSSKPPVGGCLCKQYRETMFGQILAEILPSYDFPPRRAELILGRGDGPNSSPFNLDGRPTGMNLGSLGSPGATLMSQTPGSSSLLNGGTHGQIINPVMSALEKGTGVSKEEDEDPNLPPPPTSDEPGRPLPFNNHTTPTPPDIYLEFSDLANPMTVGPFIAPNISGGPFNTDFSRYLRYDPENERLEDILQYAIETAPPTSTFYAPKQSGPPTTEEPSTPQANNQGRSGDKDFTNRNSLLSNSSSHESSQKGSDQTSTSAPPRHVYLISLFLMNFYQLIFSL